ncbi:MAG: hypothetical protein K2I83_01580 [Bacteroidales bacterium]|nr:hypothetical protein [Bacteroidales bacterium]
MFPARTPKRIKLTPAEKEAIYALPLHMQYEVVCVNIATRHRVLQHILVDPAARDYKQVRAVAIAYTEECDCWINPVVMPQAVTARQKLYPGIEDNANPDLKTDKYGYIDVKSPSNKSNVVSNANLACRQGGIAVVTDLLLKEVLKHKMILQLTAKIFSKQNKNHFGEPNYFKDEIHWFVNGKLLKYNRSETL